MFKLFKRKPKQYTLCFCPKCNNELVSSYSFVEDQILSDVWKEAKRLIQEVISNETRKVVSTKTS